MDGETAEVRPHVYVRGLVIEQEQEDMRNAEKVRVKTRMHKKPFKAMSNAIGDCLSYVASFNDEDDGNTTKMMKMIQRWASGAKTTNPVVGWAHSAHDYHSAWRVPSQSS